ncbi:putative cyclin-dependent serine/threonine-protein kinase DDB_G0272797/DDB_G0274007 [Drosophila busckii]|uniref:putative cyclin-dependent serine/threonine-protein kinase DDB_G0272797/DDB_G0274007 n=1 Tax=Drosophila busckii TaxID=30019 RepID=UPI00083EC8F9|nr:putative cyclin-dependent serine/threonine-protein kinase DDB_G0272797/DDB_G0274007 [Drosophila busckii]
MLLIHSQQQQLWLLLTTTTALAAAAATLTTQLKQRMDLGAVYGHNNMAEALRNNRWRPLESSLPQRYAFRYTPMDVRRSQSEAAGEGRAAALLNGLTNLSGLGHISNGYGAVAPAYGEASSKQEIPIYEEQHEDAEAAVAAVAATNGDYADTAAAASPSGYGSQQHSSAIYSSYPAAHSGWHPSLPSAQAYESQAEQQQSAHSNAYDKISVGNFLHHYEHNSGYDAYQSQQHAEQQQQEQQQQQHQEQQQQQEELEHASYFAPSADADSHSDDFEHAPGHEEGNNYLHEAGGGGGGGGGGGHAHSQHHHHVDIINYVPVKHVKKQHVPVEQPVKIPISHAVIIPIKKPVPIHIPITKQVTVPVEKELKVPVERLVPVPVEKHIPVPVEKRVPYTVIKYLPIKVPKPFPVKVPVFKTVLHKVKSWW